MSDIERLIARLERSYQEVKAGFGGSGMYLECKQAAAALREQDKRIEELESQLESQLSIAEIAAQRGMEPKDVAINILESNGFKRAIDGNQSWLQIHVCDKTYVAGVDYEKVTMEGPNKNEFTLPYTAVTPALIKAVCGGGE